MFQISSDIHWKWTPCFYLFEASIEGTTIFRPSNLKQAMMVENLDITMNKNLMFCEEVGWNWHKSWNIPTISLAFEKKQEEYLKKDFFISLHLIKKMKEKDNVMIDLGLKGDTILKLEGKSTEKIEFSSIKIMTTSFSHNGEKFYFLITFYEESNTIKTPIQSFISPPFFIDSREAARKNSHSQYKQISPFLDPFLPGHLLKDFVKRKNRSVKDRGDIENSLDGLYNYLSAPNIRFKVKHPLFLLIKFSEAFSLYYKKNIACKSDNIILEIQENLFSNYSNFISKDNTKKNKCEDFIILVKNYQMEDKTKKQKINGLFHIINNYLISIVMSNSDIPIGYDEYRDLNKLKKEYKEAYPYLISEKMFSLSHIFGSEKKEAKAQFIEKNLFQKHSISLEEQALKKKVKIEKTDEFNENFDKIPLIRDYDPELDESNPIKIITSINLITNKQNCKKNSLFQETKKQEIKEETIEKIEKNSKIKNNFEEIQSFMSIYDIYFNNMFFVPDFKNLFNMRKYFEDRI